MFEVICLVQSICFRYGAWFHDPPGPRAAHGLGAVGAVARPRGPPQVHHREGWLMDGMITDGGCVLFFVQKLNKSQFEDVNEKKMWMIFSPLNSKLFSRPDLNSVFALNQRTLNVVSYWKKMNDKEDLLNAEPRPHSLGHLVWRHIVAYVGILFFRTPPVLAVGYAHNAIELWGHLSPHPSSQ